MQHPAQVYWQGGEELVFTGMQTSQKNGPVEHSAGPGLRTSPLPHSAEAACHAGPVPPAQGFAHSRSGPLRYAAAQEELSLDPEESELEEHEVTFPEFSISAAPPHTGSLRVEAKISYRKRILIAASVRRVRLIPAKN
jgi:hypothetical protein